MKFEEIKVGLTAELNHVITEKDIQDFVNLTGDDNRLHTDSKYAAKTELKKPVAHGMLGASFISTIIGTKIPGDGALWFSQSLEFIAPVRVDDSIKVKVEVIKKHSKSRIIELKTDIYNQYRQKVTQGIAKVKIVEQEVEPVVVSNEIKKRQVALVVGGSGGIGSATVIALANAGYDLAIHYHKNRDSAEKVLSKLQNISIEACIWGCDVTDQEDVKNMIEGVTRRLGKISILINCSTQFVPYIKFNDLKWTDFESHWHNQIRGTFNLIKAVTPNMEEDRFGKIILIDSKYVDAPETNLLPYITSKSALRGFSKSIALDLATKGILVNMVSPGMTNTDLISDVPERTRMVAAAKTPLRRLASSKDVANVIVFLSSNNSNYLCGETIRVNGGQMML